MKNKNPPKNKLIIISLAAFFLAAFIFEYFVYAHSVDTISWYERQSQPHPDYDGLQSAPNASWFEVDGCGSGTMLDTTTNLCWERSPLSTTGNWANRKAYCEGLSLGDKGAGEWRLPEPKELRGLVHTGISSGYGDHLNSIGFSNFVNNVYLTGTLTEWDSGMVWFVLFSNGSVGYDAITTGQRAVCVSWND